MTRDEKIQRIFAVILESTETEVAFDETTLLAEDMGLSSMEFMILLTDLEAALNVEIPVAELIHVTTVGSLCDILVAIM